MVLKKRSLALLVTIKKKVDMPIHVTFKRFLAKNYVSTLFYPPVIELGKPKFLNLITAIQKELNFSV